MLELTFYDKQNNPETLPVSQYCYERLAKLGFAEKVKYKDLCLTIEGEEYIISAAELTKENRETFLVLIEFERQNELEKIFSHINENPTIKEIREKLSYIKELTILYKKFKLDNNLYFSYE